MPTHCHPTNPTHATVLSSAATESPPLRPATTSPTSRQRHSASWMRVALWPLAACVAAWPSRGHLVTTSSRTKTSHRISAWCRVSRYVCEIRGGQCNLCILCSTIFFGKTHTISIVICLAVLSLYLVLHLIQLIGCGCPPTPRGRRVSILSLRWCLGRYQCKAALSLRSRKGD